MSRKNRTNRPAPRLDATDGDRHPRAVSDATATQKTPTTEDKVLAALNANPASTTATLATAAGVGRSTAAKILARWGRDGTAIRTAGDGPRNPDTWTPIPSDHDTTAPSTDDAHPDAAAGNTANTSEATPETVSDTDDAPEPTATDTAQNEVDPTTTADDTGTTPLPDTSPKDPTDGATKPEPSVTGSPAVTDIARLEKDRLPKGGLRAIVEEYLTEHPGEDFGPAKIGKNLGRSGGAVNNALEKLVADGYAIKTCEAPKRFAINPDKTDVPNTVKGATEPALKA
ncbi:hypothetical protein ACFQ05_26485 [Amycolatopsis umgeniensis]|uniref:DNA-binding MarR family transcriptional regulator n=1 Tax=Amycolatopsis umgeniensis TaxID=336628 RepID=A0A841BBU5_9PSEU|nr:hypothetical protein [Amycolatopsis umgeniensis]MBB5856430.1 DNA-binding MarR family transcriptional regulator [Amycolatopsis umgeniensis]